jgi:hypothetical protein
LISRIALFALPPDQQQRIEAVARAITQR